MITNNKPIGYRYIQIQIFLLSGHSVEIYAIYLVLIVPSALGSSIVKDISNKNKHQTNLELE